MSMYNQMKICKHCENEVVDIFCAHCGHPQELQRINRKYIVSEIGSVLNFHKGILRSCLRM